MTSRALEVLQGVFIDDTPIGNDLAIRIVDALQSANLHILEDSATVRDALKLGLDTVNESFEHVATQDDLLLAQARHRAIADALALVGNVSLTWRLIETAPRYGTEIIGAFWRRYDEETPPTVYGPWTLAWDGRKWRSSWDGFEVIDHMSDFGTDYKGPDIEPTHWQPMPSPDTLALLPRERCDV